MKVKEMFEEIETGDVNVTVVNNLVTIKGAKGEISRDFKDPKVKLEFKDGVIKIFALNATKREKTMIGTYKAHVKNMLKGVKEGHKYVLKICTGHFPMNVTLSNNLFSVKNFLGEKVPRNINIKPGVEVKIEGEIITVTSVSKELAGQTAADMEQLTRITDRDLNKFQDGIYIINKDGKEI